MIHQAFYHRQRADIVRTIRTVSARCELIPFFYRALDIFQPSLALPFLFLIFVLCCQSSANVAFLLVYFQNFFDGGVHLRTYNRQFFGYVFMYSRFGNSELFCSGTNSSFVFEDIPSQNDGAILDILTGFDLQYAHSNAQYF